MCAEYDTECTGRETWRRDIDDESESGQDMTEQSSAETLSCGHYCNIYIHTQGWPGKYQNKKLQVNIGIFH